MATAYRDLISRCRCIASWEAHLLQLVCAHPRPHLLYPRDRQFPDKGTACRSALLCMPSAGLQSVPQATHEATALHDILSCVVANRCGYPISLPIVIPKSNAKVGVPTEDF